MGEAERPKATNLFCSQIRPRASPPPLGAWAAGGKRAEPARRPPGRVGGRRDRSGGAGVAPERLSLLPAPSGTRAQIWAIQKPGRKSRILSAGLPLPGMGGLGVKHYLAQICVIQKPGRKSRILSAGLPLPGMGGLGVKHYLAQICVIQKPGKKSRILSAGRPLQTPRGLGVKHSNTHELTLFSPMRKSHSSALI